MTSTTPGDYLYIDERLVFIIVFYTNTNIMSMSMSMSMTIDHANDTSFAI